MRVVAIGTGPIRGEHRETVSPAAAVVLGPGERVSLANESNQPVLLLAVFAPAGFARALTRWPAS